MEAACFRLWTPDLSIQMNQLFGRLFAKKLISCFCSYPPPSFIASVMVLSHGRIT